MLGAGESGKSTILKQMKLIHDDGYNKDDRDSFKEVIFSNCAQSMRAILEAMQYMEIGFQTPGMEPYTKVIFSQPTQIDAPMMPPELTEAIEKLWQDPGVQECFSRSSEFQLNDSAK